MQGHLSNSSFVQGAHRKSIGAPEEMTHHVLFAFQVVYCLPLLNCGIFADYQMGYGKDTLTTTWMREF